MKAGKPSRLIDAQPLERGTDIAVDDEFEPVDKQLGVALHIVFDPVEHQTDKGCLLYTSDAADE